MEREGNGEKAGKKEGMKGNMRQQRDGEKGRRRNRRGKKEKGEMPRKEEIMIERE